MGTLLFVLCAAAVAYGMFRTFKGGVDTVDSIVADLDKTRTRLVSLSDRNIDKERAIQEEIERKQAQKTVLNEERVRAVRIASNLHALLD